MSTPFYKSTVGTFIRQTEALSAIMAKGREHFAANGIDPDQFSNQRLCEDMLPFSFQINSVNHHSGGAIEALSTGTFGPPSSMPASDYASLEAHLKNTVEALRAVTPDAFEQLSQNDVAFVMGDMKIPFTGAGFLSSFSLPNYYFHLTTAYNLLRQKGVPLGKRDFLGQMDVNVG